MTRYILVVTTDDDTIEYILEAFQDLLHTSYLTHDVTLTEEPA